MAAPDWTLQIKFVQDRDAGLYECQVSTHPPTSIFLELKVVAFQPCRASHLMTIISAHLRDAVLYH
uniref:Ig-like domain-containing protein n=1 Tax=Anopheles coluzzii TaxID=1518534 RepID=A0A8W7PQB3_ANOCL